MKDSHPPTYSYILTKGCPFFIFLKSYPKTVLDYFEKKTAQKSLNARILLKKMLVVKEIWVKGKYYV